MGFGTLIIKINDNDYHFISNGVLSTLPAGRDRAILPFGTPVTCRATASHSLHAAKQVTWNKIDAAVIVA
jgi:hypothetical protein